MVAMKAMKAGARAMTGGDLTSPSTASYQVHVPSSRVGGGAPRAAPPAMAVRMILRDFGRIKDGMMTVTDGALRALLCVMEMLLTYALDRRAAAEIGRRDSATWGLWFPLRGVPCASAHAAPLPPPRPPPCGVGGGMVVRLWRGYQKLGRRRLWPQTREETTELIAEGNEKIVQPEAGIDRAEADAAVSTGEMMKLIAVSAARLKEIDAITAENGAKISEMTLKYEATLEEYQSDWEQLQKAIALRMKENQELHTRETELIAAIKAAKNAVIVLSKYCPDLLQVQQAVKLLQKAKVAQLVDSTGAFSTGNAALFREFLRQAPLAGSFAQIPGFRSDAPQGGQIFGILEQMKEQFDKDLVELQEGEKTALADFESLKLAKEDQLAEGKKLMVQLEAWIADFKEKNAALFAEFEDVSKVLADAQTFPAKLRKVRTSSGG
jgi:hypothetical protein